MKQPRQFCDHKIGGDSADERRADCPAGQQRHPAPIRFSALEHLLICGRSETQTSFEP